MGRPVLTVGTGRRQKSGTTDRRRGWFGRRAEGLSVRRGCRDPAPAAASPRRPDPEPHRLADDGTSAGTARRSAAARGRPDRRGTPLRRQYCVHAGGSQ